VRDNATGEAPGPARVGARPLVGLYLLLVGLYLLTTPGDFRSIDEVLAYLTTQSLVERQSLAISDVTGAARGVDGQRFDRAEPAQAILSVPLYLLGRYADEAGSPAMRYLWAGPNLSLWGGSVPIYFVALFNQLVTPLVALFVFLFCIELGARRGAALLTTLAFALGTAAWEQSRNYFQHPLEALTLLAATYVLFHARHSDHVRPALLAGALMGTALLTRVNTAAAIPLLALYLVVAGDQTAASVSAATDSAGHAANPPLVRQLLRNLATWARYLVTRLRRKWRPLLAFALPVLFGVAVLGLLNYLRFGSGLAVHGIPEDRIAGRVANAPLDGLYGNLLSPGRSLLLYSPPIIIGLFAFRHFYRQHRQEAVLFASIALVYLLFYSSFRWWAGGWAWGPRFLFAITPLLVIPCAQWIHTRARATALAVALVVGVGVQMTGVAIHWGYVYLEWGKLGFIPEDVYLFYPRFSAIPTHLGYLLQGRYLDPWLVWVYREVGVGPALFALAAAPSALLILGLSLLWQPHPRRIQADALNREELAVPGK
jgi:hypothetical protein